jgi:nicotinamidase-related amidase
MPRTALFVIDIQRGLVDDPKTQIPHALRIRQSTEEILAAARDIVDQYRTAQRESPSVIVFVRSFSLQPLSTPRERMAPRLEPKKVAGLWVRP